MAAKVRGAYWQGIRLWEVFQKIDPWAQRTTDAAHQGVEQKYQTRNADSPNFGRQMQVRTVVAADEDRREADAPDWIALLIQLLDVEKDLVALAAGTPQGDLCICYDVNRKADVSGAETAGTAVVVEYTGLSAGWVPTVGRYVLARNPTTGAGFASPITAVVANTSITIDLDVNLTNAWDLVDVQIVLPDCAYRTMNGGTIDEWDEKGSPDVTYEFDCESDPLFHSDYVTAHDN